MLIKLCEMLGLKDIDFDSHPQFSKDYLLKGADEAAVRRCFHPAVLTFFEQHTGKRQWVATEGLGSILVYSSATGEICLTASGSSLSAKP